MMHLESKILRAVTNVPDFPKPGVVFKDIGPLLRDPELFYETIATMAKQAEASRPDYIVGVESRGFLFGVPIAIALGCPFVPARKKGKLPGRILRESYSLEYGTDDLEIQADSVKKNKRYLIVDDVLATGGTASAVARLLQKNGGSVAGILFLMELTFLNGRDILTRVIPDKAIASLVKV